MRGALAGRRALVVGASSGIGLAVCRRLLEDGAAVHAIARRPIDADVTAHAVDVTDADAARGEIDAIGVADGVDLLIFCVGQQTPARKLTELTPRTWQALVGANLTSAFNVLSAALPHLLRQPSDVLLVSSISAQWPDQSGPAYQAAKAGLLALSRAAGFETLGEAVRFTCVLPGLVNTPLLSQRPQPPSEEDRERALRPEDIANVCAFVAGLPRHVLIPEITVLPTALQRVGRS